jgi:hypothetical protein
LTDRARIQWSPDRKPKCYDTLHDWHEWLSVKSGAWSPCADCTPCHRARMQAELRCERPEVIFVVDRETREIEGVVAEDPRYARIVLGMALSKCDVLGRTVEPTDTWAALLEHVKRRAHKDVKRAIEMWMHRRRKADGNKC